MSNVKPTDSTVIIGAIKAGVQKEAERVFEEVKTQMLKDFEARKDQIVSGVVLNVMRYVQMETLHDYIHITIKKEPVEAPTPQQ